MATVPYITIIVSIGIITNNGTTTSTTAIMYYYYLLHFLLLQLGVGSSTASSQGFPGRPAAPERAGRDGRAFHRPGTDGREGPERGPSFFMEGMYIFRPGSNTTYNTTTHNKQQQHTAQQNSIQHNNNTTTTQTTTCNRLGAD